MVRSKWEDDLSGIDDDDGGDFGATSTYGSQDDPYQQHDDSSSESSSTSLPVLTGKDARLQRFKVKKRPPGTPPLDWVESDHPIIPRYSTRAQFIAKRISHAKSSYRLLLNSIQISSVPSTCFSSLPDLRSLILNDNRIASLSPDISTLRSLTCLNLSSNRLRSLPPSIGDLPSLEILSLNLNRLSSLPPEMGKLSRLLRLDLCSNAIESLPVEIGGLNDNYETTIFEGNGLSVYPAEVIAKGWKAGLYRFLKEFLKLRSSGLLNLSRMDLETIPDQVVSLEPMELITSLDISFNQLQSLNPLLVLSRLETLSIKGNPGIEELPRGLALLPKMKTLIYSEEEEAREKKGVRSGKQRVTVNSSSGSGSGADEEDQNDVSEEDKEEDDNDVVAMTPNHSISNTKRLRRKKTKEIRFQQVTATPSSFGSLVSPPFEILCKGSKVVLHFMGVVHTLGTTGCLDLCNIGLNELPWEYDGRVPLPASTEEEAEDGESKTSKATLSALSGAATGMYSSRGGGGGGGVSASTLLPPSSSSSSSASIRNKKMQRMQEPKAVRGSSFLQSGSSNLPTIVQKKKATTPSASSSRRSMMGSSRERKLDSVRPLRTPIATPGKVQEGKDNEGNGENSNKNDNEGSDGSSSSSSRNTSKPNSIANGGGEPEENEELDPSRRRKSSSASSLSLTNNNNNKANDEGQHVLIVDAVRSVLLDKNRLSSLPDRFKQFTRVTRISLNNNRFTEFPQILRKMPWILHLSLHGNYIQSIPKWIYEKTTNLRSLDVGENRISTLPVEMVRLKQLETLILLPNPLHSPLLDIAQQRTLDVIMRYLKLFGLTDGSGRLNIDGMGLESLPLELEFSRLVYLKMADNPVVNLDTRLKKSVHLVNLNASRCHLLSVPDWFAQKLTKIVQLDLSDNRLRPFPLVICSLPALRKINLANNGFSDLPSNIRMLNQLQILRLEHNRIVEVPPSISSCSSLEFLDLSHNALRSLPPEIAQCVSIRTLIVNTNPLKEIPEEMGSMWNLATLDLKKTRVMVLPPALGQLQSVLVNLTTNDPDEMKRPPSQILKLGAGQTLSYLFAQYRGNTEMLLDLSYSAMPTAGAAAAARRGGGGGGAAAATSSSMISWHEFVIKDLGAFPALTELDLTQCALSQLPNEVCLLMHLTRLCCANNQVREIPSNLRTLQRLRVLDASNNWITSMPICLVAMPDLKFLNFMHNRLRTLYVVGNNSNSGNEDDDYGDDSFGEHPQRKIQRKKIDGLIRRGFGADGLVRVDVGGKAEGNIDDEGWLIMPPAPGAANMTKKEERNSSTSHSQERRMKKLEFLEDEQDPVSRYENRIAVRNKSNRPVVMPSETATLSLVSMGLEPPLAGSTLMHEGLQQSSRPNWLQAGRTVGETLWRIVRSKLPVLIEQRVKLRRRERQKASLLACHNLETLWLGHNWISDVPVLIAQLSNLTSLRLERNTISTFHVDIAKLTRLTELDMSVNKLKMIPGQIGNMTNLTSLKCAGNELERIPEEMRNLLQLTELDLSDNMLHTLPESVLIAIETSLQSLRLNGNPLSDPPPAVVESGADALFAYVHNARRALLKGTFRVVTGAGSRLDTVTIDFCKFSALTELRMSETRVPILPPAISLLTCLKKLYVPRNRLAELPSDQVLACLVSLVSLDCSSNLLKVLPGALGKLPKLRLIRANDNLLMDVHDNLTGLERLKRIDISHNNLFRLPRGSPWILSCQEFLASHNDFEDLPPSISFGRCLKTLNLSYNRLERLGDSIGNLEGLETLILSHNILQTIPEAVGNLTSLTLLDISRNKISALPRVVWYLTRLTTLCIRQNDFVALPKEMGHLRSLQDLDCTENPLLSLPDSLLHSVTSLTKLQANPHQITPTARFSLATEKALEIVPVSAHVVQLRAITQVVTEADPLSRISSYIRRVENSVTVTSLDLSGMKLESVPKELKDMSCLTSLDLHGNRIRILDDDEDIHLDMPDEEGGGGGGMDEGSAAKKDFIKRKYMDPVLKRMYVDEKDDDEEEEMNYYYFNPLGQNKRKNKFVCCFLTTLTMLDLSANDLLSIPRRIGLLTRLECLRLGQNQLTELPATIRHLKCLTELSVDGNCLTPKLPEEMATLVALRQLDATANELVEISDCFSQLVNMREVKLANSCLTCIPEGVCRMFAVELLDISSSRVSHIPESIGLLTLLTELHVESNMLRSLPSSMSALGRLAVFNAASNVISRFPDGMLRGTTSLRKIDLSANSLEKLSDEIQFLTALVNLNVEHNQLKELSPFLGALRPMRKEKNKKKRAAEVERNSGQTIVTATLEEEEEEEESGRYARMFGLSTTATTPVFNSMSFSLRRRGDEEGSLREEEEEDDDEFATRGANNSLQLSSLSSSSMRYDVDDPLSFLKSKWRKQQHYLQSQNSSSFVDTTNTTTTNNNLPFDDPVFFSAIAATANNDSHHSRGKLRKFSFANNPIEMPPPSIAFERSLPDLFEYLDRLRVGQLTNCMILSHLHLAVVQLPPARFQFLSRIDMSCNKLAFLPANLNEITALELIDAHQNYLTTLPSNLSTLSRLRILNISSNAFTSVPRILRSPSFTSLEHLCLIDNPLTMIDPPLDWLSGKKIVQNFLRVQVSASFFSVAANGKRSEFALGLVLRVWRSATLTAQAQRAGLTGIIDDGGRKFLRGTF